MAQYQPSERLKFSLRKGYILRRFSFEEPTRGIKLVLKLIFVFTGSLDGGLMTSTFQFIIFLVRKGQILSITQAVLHVIKK